MPEQVELFNITVTVPTLEEYIKDLPFGELIIENWQMDDSDMRDELRYGITFANWLEVTKPELLEGYNQHCTHLCYEQIQERNDGN